MQGLVRAPEDEGSIYAARQRMRVVYMQQDRGRVQYICSKTGDGGSIYAAKQGMRACNNTNMRNPIIRDVGSSYAYSRVTRKRSCIII